MDFPKKQAQRLMPLYLLEYSEKLFTNHPNPEDPWGGGSDYTAGQGITITNNEISVDTNVIATKSDLPTKTSELTNDSDFISSSLGNTKPYSKYESSPLGGSWKRVTYDTSGILIETNDTTHLLGFPINKEGEIVVSSDIPDFSNYYCINNEIQSGEYITKINGNGLEYSKQWTPNSISITANCTEMGFDNKPGIVIKTDMNKKVVVSDSIAVYNTEHNSVTGIDGDNVTVSSIDGRYTRLENGKLTYEGDWEVREFNLPTTKGQGTYTLATTDDYPIDDPVDQLFISLTGQENTFYKKVNLSDAPGRMFYVNLSALNPVFKDGLTSTYNEQTNQLEVGLNAVIPTKTSDLFNDSGYVTETWVQNQGYITNAALNNYVTTTQLNDSLDDYALKTDVPTDISELNNDAGYATQTWVENKGYATSSSLATVATTGNYNDLTNKPTATSTSTSTVTPTTIELVFTYEDNTTQTITLMTGATVSTSTTTTLS